MPNPTITFIRHPDGAFRVGDFLCTNLNSTKWTHFYACVAFVKRSGVAHVQEALSAFSQDRDVRISVGLDHGVTSLEGVTDLKRSLGARGRLFAFKNANSSTFHPKAYLFRNDEEADAVMGSSNLTEGGLYTNYECSLRAELTFSNPVQRALYESVQEQLDTWSTVMPGLCLELTDQLIQQLNATGDLPSEAQIRERERRSRGNQKPAANAPASPFQSHPVPPAPPPPTTHPRPGGARAPNLPGSTSSAAKAASSGAASPTITPTVTSASGRRTFGMTLQKTDVGVGRMTPGASGRSPEVFIPITALDLDPAFWGWTNRTTPGPNYVRDIAWAGRHAAWLAKKRVTSRTGRPLDKLDWNNVTVQLAGHPAPFDIDIWFNPDKVDIRLRHSNLRAAGSIDDIMLIRQAPLRSGCGYDIEVIHKSDSRYSHTLAQLTTSIRGNSRKKIGYF